MSKYQPGRVPTNLPTILRQRGISQDRLSKMANLSFGQISRLATGRHRPQTATANAIANVLGVDVDDIWPVG